MAKVNFLEELRAKTSPMHKALEQTSISKQIISPELTKAQYEAYLQKMLCIHQSVEENVFSALSSYIKDIEERKKTIKILSDLKSLQAINEPCSIKFITNDFISSIPFCMGVIYVTEGSTLGGMYIIKNVLAALGEDAKTATHFLNCYGQFTGSKWKTFLENLNTYLLSASAKEKDEIIAGAVYGFNRTFELFNS